MFQSPESFIDHIVNPVEHWAENSVECHVVGKPTMSIGESSSDPSMYIIRFSTHRGAFWLDVRYDMHSARDFRDVTATLWQETIDVMHGVKLFRVVGSSEDFPMGKVLAELETHTISGEELRDG